MKALWGSFAVLLLATGAGAQQRDGWRCVDGLCSQIEPLPVASLGGVFAHAKDVSGARDVERMAALEQQRWREFRFDVVEDGRITIRLSIDPEYRPEGWPPELSADQIEGVTLFTSTDGENYTVFDSNTAVQAGEFLSVIVGQKTEDLDSDSAIFFPAKWQLDVSAYHVIGQSLSRSSVFCPTITDRNSLACIGVSLSKTV